MTTENPETEAAPKRRRLPDGWVFIMTHANGWTVAVDPNTQAPMDRLAAYDMWLRQVDGLIQPRVQRLGREDSERVLLEIQDAFAGVLEKERGV